MKMHLQIEYYNKIKSGEKVIELRLYDEKRQALKVWDIVEFYNMPDSSDIIKCEVVELHKSADFKQLMNKIDCRKCGFNSIDDAMRIVEQFYPLPEQQKYGVIGIEIKCL